MKVVSIERRELLHELDGKSIIDLFFVYPRVVKT